MLIDDFLPVYDKRSTYNIEINSTIEKIYENVCSLNFSESRIIKFLFKLRGMPDESLTLKGLERCQFVKLGERKNDEILLGVIGRFWTLSGDLQKFLPEEFKSFNKEGYAKAVWNFKLTEISNGKTNASTETRVYCIGKKSKKLFLIYWSLVGPFSGRIRKEALRIIKRNSEV